MELFYNTLETFSSIQDVFLFFFLLFDNSAENRMDDAVLLDIFTSSEGYLYIIIFIEIKKMEYNIVI